jgi:hypothetical protein
LNKEKMNNFPFNPYNQPRSNPIQIPKRPEPAFISEGVKPKMTVQELRQLCKEYNESVIITGYSKATRKVVKQKLKEKGVL